MLMVMLSACNWHEYRLEIYSQFPVKHLHNISLFSHGKAPSKSLKPVFNFKYLKSGVQLRCDNNCFLNSTDFPILFEHFHFFGAIFQKTKFHIWTFASVQFRIYSVQILYFPMDAALSTARNFNSFSTDNCYFSYVEYTS